MVRVGVVGLGLGLGEDAPKSRFTAQQAAAALAALEPKPEPSGIPFCTFSETPAEETPSSFSVSMAAMPQQFSAAILLRRPWQRTRKGPSGTEHRRCLAGRKWGVGYKCKGGGRGGEGRRETRTLSPVMLSMTTWPGRSGRSVAVTMSPWPSTATPRKSNPGPAGCACDLTSSLRQTLTAGMHSDD